MKKYISLIIIIISALQIAGAQCFPNRHSTNFYDGWISCEASTSPNATRPKGHFIMYDFGKIFSLGQMLIWNTNDPAHLDWGMQEVSIDYSTDGISWVHAGDFIFPQASGQSTYEGAEGPHLNNVEARFLLLTALTNYGGECYGLGEMNIAAEEVIISDVDDILTLDCVDVTLYPNPFADKLTMNFVSECKGDFYYRLYDALGHEVMSDKINLQSGQNVNLEIGQHLSPGSYVLQFESEGNFIQKSIVKVGNERP